MKNKMLMTTGIAAGTVAGMAVGAALGLAVSGSCDKKDDSLFQCRSSCAKSRKSKNKLGKIASQALGAMGDAFHNVADLVK